jgi:hypothetical protein
MLPINTRKLILIILSVVVILAGFSLAAQVLADWTTGKFGGAFEFSGFGDVVDIGDVGSVQTVEFWIYDLIATSTETTDGIMELIDDTTYIYVTSTSAIGTAGFNSPTIYVNGSDATTSLRDGWNHVAVVDSSAVNAISFTIGEANDDYFYGKIDEVRIYNRALSEAEIRFHYNRGGPIAHWKFNEGTGTTTYDSTEYYNHGTLGDGTCEPGSGTCPTWIPGKYGPALQFDGSDDYVNVPDSESLDVEEEITIDFWVNITGEP